MEAGEVLLLTGKALTGRDAAHKRMTEILSRGESCRWIFATGSFTTWGQWTRCARRWLAPRDQRLLRAMDKFTRQMLAETGLLGMVGKAERGLRPSTPSGSSGRFT